jgi:tetratricopeptide (TPR) repeat protein
VPPTIPQALLQNVRDGRAVLFLGAGATYGALHPDGRKAPIGSVLADELAEKFLGPSFKGRPLDQIAELAISETSLREVQGYIYEIFSKFSPASFHRLIPEFRWVALATTNYDFVVERAYEAAGAKTRQEVVAIVKDGQRIEEMLSHAQHGVPLLKLHGCLSMISDDSVPLILTPEQYITHRANRRRLFEKFFSFAHEYPVIYAGYSLVDTDLRALLLELQGQGAANTPRSYIVAPNIPDADSRLWEGRKITCIRATFQDFVETLAREIPPQARGLKKLQTTDKHPIERHLKIGLTETLDPFLYHQFEVNLEYVHQALSCQSIAPRDFYKGVGGGWSPIVQNLDVQRSVYQQIVSDVIEGEGPAGPAFYLVKGHAGAGKSVALRRLAWMISDISDVPCLFLRTDGVIDSDAISELLRLADKRIFLCLDHVAKHRRSVAQLLRLAEKNRWNLTVIAAERHHEWNDTCGELDAHLTNSYELRYLNEREIDELVTLLERHKSLGHLAPLSPAERRSALSDRAGRQLLVALHEATLGRPFQEIILDEYHSIATEEARSFYLSVCILHQLRVDVRAGFIARVHGIPLEEFYARLAQPLESIVFARRSERLQDYCYVSRHALIAQMVAEGVLVDPDIRMAEYSRIVSFLDPDFEGDRIALRSLVQANHLLRFFSAPELPRQLFEMAQERDLQGYILLQQRAIFEMKCPDGDLSVAEKYLADAESRAPHDPAVQHSLVELDLRRSRDQRISIARRVMLRQRVKRRARAIIEKRGDQSHPFHSLLLVLLDEIEEVLGVASASGSDDTTLFVSEFEECLSRGLNRFPGDEYLLSAEAKMSELLGNSARSMQALQKAFSGSSNASPYVALRLAKQYMRASRTDDARGTLRASFEANPLNKDVAFELGKFIAGPSLTGADEARFYLRKAFIRGDTNFEAQFYFAAAACVAGSWDEARPIFQSLRSASVHDSIKRRVRLRTHLECLGVVTSLVSNGSFVRDDKTGFEAYVPDGEISGSQRVRRGARVQFHLAFNFFGPVAVNLRFGS